jgi:1-acyl-sn-glycerol-3-phosphate acyltransferase
VALAWALLMCIVRLGAMRLRGPMTPARRALWLHACCQRVLTSLGIRFRAIGLPPPHGLVVANHLSYLDILIIGAAMPCVFVSKAEVGRWPFFGWAARVGGTLFLDRSSRASAAVVAQEMCWRLEHSVPVLLFPEGTSTDGARVLRFHSTLFDPAITVAAPITAAAVRYAMDDGAPERDLCWYGDDEFLSHLWKTLGTPGFSAEVRFAQPQVYSDRRAAALAAHGQVVAMRAAMRAPELAAADSLLAGHR